MLIAELPGRLQQQYEVRILMPKYGIIDDRKWRLHEVKRLSGITIRLGTMDYALNVKVASIPGTRTQVYFLDNHELWARRGTFTDLQTGEPYSDNDERLIFFSKGVIQVLKKLGWFPQVIHCNGWMTGLLPLYIRHQLRGDPQLGKAELLFTNYHEEIPGLRFSTSFPEKAKIDNYIPDILRELAGDPYEGLLEAGRSCAESLEGAPNPEAWTACYEQLLTHQTA